MVSIVGGKAYTMGSFAKKENAPKERDQFLLAFDLATQKKLWQTSIGPSEIYAGPGSTPTVEGDRLYALGHNGELVCAETGTGKIVWQKNLAKDFEGQVMHR